MLWPDSTNGTASCLNSSVYRARVALIIVFPFADCQLWDTSGGGKINRRFGLPTLRSLYRSVPYELYPCNMKDLPLRNLQVVRDR
jgi:hypothetical protein